MSWFKYNYALVRQIPNSLETEAVRMNNSEAVDFKQARQEYQNYKTVLEKCGVKPVEVEKDEQFPDCVFVEDAAVVIGDKAFMTRQGHPSRRGEVILMPDNVLKNKLDLNIVDMCNDKDDSTIDGGDVLFTGKEILVGLSKRTNAGGIKKIADTFPDYPVTSIPVHSSVLHLKSIATMFGEDIMAVGGSLAAKSMFQSIKEKAKFKYQYIELMNDQSSNGLFINGILVHKTQAEIGDRDYQTIVSSIKGKRLETCLKELYKVDGCLTCCSLLINNEKISS
ncbi:hypothetical protein LOTGIDRAFT_119867 [Lottia gigantea]|uniref:Uncharacterized protein n=1 Tax=Lottia gigantea TaxID=225164 RepID=V3ZP34_LOTGI|nr:hypothetical protein LOTGIDRAFT_119867 [Lottia gigantea]ESO93153.1 hypothetical protein LOTGIDRAFT_119867 [Lottia gigantea]